jgi:hypothetical protein
VWPRPDVVGATRRVVEIDRRVESAKAVVDTVEVAAWIVDDHRAVAAGPDEVKAQRPLAAVVHPEVGAARGESCAASPQVRYVHIATGGHADRERIRGEPGREACRAIVRVRRVVERGRRRRLDDDLRQAGEDERGDDDPTPCGSGRRRGAGRHRRPGRCGGWGGNVGGRGVALGGTGLSVDVGSSVAVEVDRGVDREVDRGVELGGSGV